MSAHPTYGASSAGEQQSLLPGASSFSIGHSGAAVLPHPVCPVCGNTNHASRLDLLHARGGLPDSGRAEFFQRSAPPADRALPARQPTYGPAAVLFGMGGAALNLAGWFATPWSRHANPVLRFGAGPMLALYLGWLAGAALLMWIKRPQMTRAIAEYMERLRAHEAESALQERAFLIWSRLFYCARDNVVFLPGTRKSAPLEDTQAFCYRLAEQSPG